LQNCYTTTCLSLANGQRMDILYTAAEDFQVDYIYAVRCDFVSFQPVLHSVYPLTAESYKRDQEISFGTPISKRDIDVSLVEYTPHPRAYVPPPSVKFAAERLVTIDWQYFCLSGETFSGNGSVATSDYTWKVSIDGGKYRKFVHPDVPTIFDPKRTINRIEVPLGQVVDLIVFNHDTIQHPFHIHGHAFYLTGRGFGKFKKSDKSSLNLKNPVRMNVFALAAGPSCTSTSGPPCVTNNATYSPCPAGSCVPSSPQLGAALPSWTTFRIVFDHEGPWLSHCHFAEHINLGMGQVFIVDDDVPGFDVPDWIPRSTFRKIKKPEKTYY